MTIIQSIPSFLGFKATSHLPPLIPWGEVKRIFIRCMSLVAKCWKLYCNPNIFSTAKWQNNKNKDNKICEGADVTSVWKSSVHWEGHSPQLLGYCYLVSLCQSRSSSSSSSFTSFASLHCVPVFYMGLLSTSKVTSSLKRSQRKGKVTTSAVCIT